MRIGFVTGEFPPMEGGVGAFTQELAAAFTQAGHDVHVITSRDARPPEARASWRQLMEPVQTEAYTLHPLIRKWNWPSLYGVADLAVRYELELINIQYQAAAYHMRSPAANFLPWRLKGLVKTVVTFHDLRVPYLFPKAGRLRRSAVRFMARQAHGVIATNSADFEALGRLCPTPAAQIPIGSNIPSRTPPPAEIAGLRAELGLAADHKLLGYFGFLNESKGADTLIQALAALPSEVHLLFIGGQTGSSDPDNNQSFLAGLKADIAARGLSSRVHWTGFVTDSQVSGWLHAADLMVMPYRDGVSLRRGTLMAALAHGRPLISTRPEMAAPELRHGQNIHLVPVDDAAALAQAVAQLLADPEAACRLGEGARQLADLFTWDKIAHRTDQFFQEIGRA